MTPIVIIGDSFNRIIYEFLCCVKTFRAKNAFCVEKTAKKEMKIVKKRKNPAFFVRLL